jgi:hypothetical protein
VGLKRLVLPTGPEDLNRIDFTPVLGPADLKKFDVARTPNSNNGPADLKRFDVAMRLPILLNDANPPYVPPHEYREHVLTTRKP